jgi:uncharacterized Zn finger protein
MRRKFEVTCPLCSYQEKVEFELSEDGATQLTWHCKGKDCGNVVHTVVRLPEDQKIPDHNLTKVGKAKK